jgi:uncharacterized protein (TIGR02996 family)
MSPDGDDRNLELEAAIAAEPDARGGYEVYADWLAQRGDPRGELIAVQLAREARPSDPRLAGREAELLTEHGGTWLRGLDQHAWPGPPIEVEWERGFIASARIPTGYSSDDSAFTYRAFAELPCAALVREIVLGVACSSGGHGNPDDDISILEALRDQPLPTLRSIELAIFDHQISWTHLGDVSIARLDELPRLETLAITAGRMTLGAIDLPQLRQLSLVSGGQRAHVLHSIAAARWPSLEELTVYFGTDQYGGSCTLADVAPILAGHNLPNITSLGLCNSTFADELVVELVAAPILPRLKRLDLSAGTLGADGARTLLAHADKLEHLAAIALGDNYIPPDLAAELEQRLPQIVLGDQEFDGGYGRFVSVSE